VVNNDGSHAAIPATGYIALEKGFHPYILYYFEDYEGEHLSWFWKLPSAKELTPIPTFLCTQYIHVVEMNSICHTILSVSPIVQTVFRIIIANIERHDVDRLRCRCLLFRIFLVERNTRSSRFKRLGRCL